MIIPNNLDTIICASALDYLQSQPDESVNCITTSPAYYGLRKYLPVGHPDAGKEIGAEQTPEAYVENMVVICRELRRVLRGDGVFYLNLGDSYWTRSNQRDDGKRTVIKNYAGTADLPAWKDYAAQGKVRYSSGHAYLKDKDLMMIPHQVAIALQKDGWYVRQDNVWKKPSMLPESARDRTTRCHEFVFQLTKSRRYWYDFYAVAEPTSGSTGGNFSLKSAKQQPNHGAMTMNRPVDKGFRNLRSVWTINPKAFKNDYDDNHYAVMPQELAELCIKAGCPPFVCSDCGKPYLHVVTSESASADSERDYQGVPEYQSNRKQRQEPKKKGAVGTPKIIDHGYKPDCDCGAPAIPGTVIDPFMGSGTTARTAVALDRHFVGCDINQSYVDMALESLRKPFEAKVIERPEADLTLLPFFSNFE